MSVGKFDGFSLTLKEQSVSKVNRCIFNDSYPMAIIIISEKKNCTNLLIVDSS